jgi:hypothetical protein
MPLRNSYDSSTHLEHPLEVMPMHWSNRKFPLTLNLVFVSTFFFTPTLFAEALDSVQNQPPGLVTDPLIRATPELLKQGLWGLASFEVGIDSTGLVNSCTVTPSGNRAFDSLVKSKVTAARFTPAIENGRAVSSTVRFEIAVPYDSLVAQCLRLPSNFAGTVIDTAQRIYLPKTRILMCYTDTTEDSVITIGFSRYLSLIGKSSGQKYDGKLLETDTDSLGRFTFKLLPRGHFTLSVQSAGYEIGQFRGYIAGNELQQCRYVLRSTVERYHDSTDSTYEITVYGHPSFNEKTVVIADEEKHTGFSPFLSNVIQAKAEIRRIPEGPSKMLVRSGSPYDNVYVIAGVSMLAPFHFGGHPYLDIDGLMISALTNVKVTINDIGAKRVNASGCIVEADPGRIKYDNNSVAKGFYLKGDFSYSGVDLLAAYSAKKKPGDFIQLGYSVSDNFSIKWNNYEYASVRQGNQGVGIPLNYGNTTLAGSKSIASLRYTAFGWFAWDSYDVLKETVKNSKQDRDSILLYESNFLPWGMGSIKINTDSSNRSFTIGGAHQFFGSGKQVYNTVITTRSYLNNSEITIDFDTIIRTPFVTKLTTRINHDEWYGYLSQLTNDSNDTRSNFQGSETGVHFNTSLIKQTGHITTELDLLASAINYTDTTQFIGDAGVSATYTSDSYQAGIHFGRVTSRPDIRGLPDSLFRMQLNSTYIASLPLFFRYRRLTKFGITPYVRYCTNAPQLDPINQVWDPKRSTSVLALGADFDCRIVPTSWAELSTALNLANARRQSATDNSLAYEWNLPWTIRTSLHLHTRNDRIHLYIDYIRTKGLPYYNIDNQAYDALPVYRSFDLNLQVHGFIPGKQRFINKLDCFATLKNVQDLLGTSNLRDYYWDTNGNRRPVYLGNGRMDIGARFGIKL